MITGNADDTSSATVDSPAGASTDTGKNDDLDTSVPQDSIDAFEDELAGAIGSGLSFDDDEDDAEDDDVEYEDDDDGDAGDGTAGDAAPGTDEGAEAKKGGQPRDETTGRFAEKPADAKADPKADATKPAADAAKPSADTKDGDAPATPGWQPLAIKAGGKMVPVEGVHFSEVGDHLMVTVPKAKADALIGLMSRGIDHATLRSQVQRAERRIESMKNAPKRTSDAEIEAKLTLALLKPHLPELLDETQVALLEANIKNAIHEEAARYDKETRDHQSTLDAPTWEDEQATGIAHNVRHIAESFPELKGLTRDDLLAVYREMLPVASSVFFKGTGDKANQNFVNTQYIHDRLKARLEWRARNGSSAPSSDAPKGGTTTTAGGGNGKTTPAASDKKTAEAERFNRGQDTATPRSTNLKEQRGRGRPDKATRRARAAAGRSQEEDRMDAEDDLRRTTRAFMNNKSPGFDFDAPGDDES